MRNILVSASLSEEFTHDRERKGLTAAQFLERREHLLARRRNGFEPSHPQMAGGANVEPLLIPRR